MNPLTNMKNVKKLSEQELYTGNKTSWHDQYKDSAWIFVGGLPYDLSEGDIICVFSQYGEVVNINLIRAKDTGKSKGFCFLCYEDQRSTILAVDNLNGIKILKRTIRVDHVAEYKVPKEGKKTDEDTKKLYSEGCAPKATPIVPKGRTPPRDIRETIGDIIESDIKLPQRLPIYDIKQEETDPELPRQIKQEPTEKNGDSTSSKKKHKKTKKSKKKRYNSSSSDESESRKRKKSKRKDTHEGRNKKYSHSSSESD
ncbi:unnamed protein product [Acanthoscelides obtectus]|uniref:RRM domain-containing protein n=1 Tax=Acanthoscelides obtectus TaxID=200917 RepID=A0A9P0L244_ACAOB|nr:unnamed protein product [Acanthoscelides obtectus]CAK1652867.1 RNA-binding motif protein, X-linked 2 [Acanthoscelides obtectus]